MKDLVVDCISSLKWKFKSRKCKVLDQSDVKDNLDKLHADFVLVPVNKVANSVTVLCKKLLY